MKHLSGSLFLRLALLVLTAVITTQLFTAWIVMGDRRELIAKQIYHQVLDTLADLEGRMEALPPESRTLFLYAYNRPGMTQLLPGNADQGVPFESLPAIARGVSEHLSHAMGEPVVVKYYAQGERRQLWISQHILDAHYWLVVPLGRFRDDWFSPLAQASLLACLFAGLVAFSLGWVITKPISQVVQALRELEQGRHPEPVSEEHGPREVRELTRGFNTMVHSLESSAGERRLMLAGLSHDLRTPLTRLQLMVEMQDDTTDKHDMLADLEELSRIVRQFIDFARSEEPPRREPVQLAELASSVVARFNRDTSNYRLRVKSEPEIRADALALERLLSNLLENARRYGKPPVEVEIGKDGPHAVLMVQDHGDGIPAELREAALTPFERLASHRGTDGGSGLGLAIVDRVVRQHHGSLVLEDVEGGGLRVMIRLPIRG
ncbi:ATP-binding protein [Paludibacterium paludis]|uniref:histidine kinase n=1 Tax=Paludibacterium paludis TaxID=1225769 RepID=A0A918P1P3_9NEIS|nr:ATP-binding protein [Paludibacterium paludis]GGY12629.1 two-component sensor histidine kinase [Paludibacterium paludis]